MVSGRYDSRAHEISKKIMKENGVAIAAEAIEKYVGEKEHKKDGHINGEH